MAKNSFKVKNNLNIEPQSRLQSSDIGDVYFDNDKKAFGLKSNHWSFTESKIDIAYQSTIDSTYFNSEVSENSIIKVTGSPGSDFYIHGVAKNNDAKMIHIHNSTTKNMTIKHKSSDESVVSNRITTPDGEDLTIHPKNMVIFYYDDSLSNWIAVQTGGGDAAPTSGTTFDATQLGHGFSVLTPIYHDGTIWRKAQANSSVTLATYVVTAATTDTFTGMKFGVIDVTSHGLVPGEFYYVSSDTSGELTAIEPMFGYSNPVLYVEDISKIHIMAYRPSLIGDGHVSDSEIGAILPFPGTISSSGFLLCDGSAVSRMQYNELFNKIGTAYGIGDGVTTFNLPDLTDQFPDISVNYFIRYAPKGSILGESIPTGSVLSFAGPVSALPSGFLLCDGSSLNRLDYPKLFEVVGTSWGSSSSTTFNIPDTRGLFLRGVSASSGRDADTNSRAALNTGGNTGNAVGSYQDDAIKSHLHTFSGSSASVNAASGGLSVAGSTSSQSTDSTGNSETRPKNIYVNYIIRY